MPNLFAKKAFKHSFATVSALSIALDPSISLAFSCVFSDFSEATVEKYGRIKGSYNGKGGSVLRLVSGNLHSSADARETLRHEILGHYGLATFSETDKKAILDKIIASQNEPKLSKFIEINQKRIRIDKKLPKF